MQVIKDHSTEYTSVLSRLASWVHGEEEGAYMDFHQLYRDLKAVKVKLEELAEWNSSYREIELSQDLETPFTSLKKRYEPEL